VENELKTLVIADLHLGIEAVLRQKGVNIGSQTAKMLDMVTACVKEKEPDAIVLLGDIKHAVPQISFTDRKDVPQFLAALAEYAPVYIAKGNHDSQLANLLPEACKTRHEVHLKSTRGFIFDNVGYTHGHTWPSPDLFSVNFMLIGHNHPQIRLASSQSNYAKLKSVWIRAKCDYKAVESHYGEISNWSDPWIILMPAFNEISGGVTFNTPGIKLLGPIASKLLRQEDMEVYLLDGTYIGKAYDL